MSKKLITAFMAVWTGLCALHASNVITVADAGGPAGGRAEVVVSLKTDAADVVAAEIRVPLPDGAMPVAGSCTPDAGRLPSHSVTADVNGNEYVIVVFNTSLKPIAAGEGELVRFSLDLGSDPGIFDLTPKVKLSAADGSVIQAESHGGKLTVLGSRMVLGESTIDFYRLPLLSTETRTITVTNTGTAPLTLTGFSTTIEGLRATMPEPIEPGSQGELTLSYTPTKRCDAVNAHIFIESDDAVNGRQPILVKAEPYSVNELVIGDITGNIDDEVTVTVAMNNMEPIVGAEFTIKLPKGIEFVEGSLTKSQRAESMTVDGTVVNNTAVDNPYDPDFGSKLLRIVMFSLGNSPVTGSQGDILSFRVKLVRRVYDQIMPQKVILVNNAGENMASDSKGGMLDVRAPYLFCDPEFDMGNVSLVGTRSVDFSISNYGNAPLTIDRVVFTDSRLRCDAPMPITLKEGEYMLLPVTVDDTTLGSFATTMNIYSNDPDNRMMQIEVKGNLYSPNELKLNGKLTDGKFSIDVSLDNTAEIVALQLDVVCPPGMTTDESMLTLADRAAGHSAAMAEVETGRYRIILFSLSNKEFEGNSGTLFTLGFNGTDLTGKYVTVEGIKLSSADGRNFTTPDTDVQIGQVPEETPNAVSITLDQTYIQAEEGQEVQLTATVLPAEASAQPLEWRSSDEAVATVTQDGLVKIVAPGVAIVTVSTTDGTNLTAECRVTGMSGIENIVIDGNDSITVYTTGGILIYRNATRVDLDRLARGIYIINGRKVRL